MSAPLIVDIETVPTDAAMALPYPEDRQPPGNMSKPETIAAWREKDRETWQTARIKEYSLNPRYGRVLCLGFALDNDAPQYCLAESEKAEAVALSCFWRLVRDAEGRVVTWNGAWDLRFLVVRSLVRGIEPTVDAETINRWFKKYSVRPHCDVKALLTNWDYTDGHLDEWCEFFALPGKKNGMSGADVYALYQKGELATIADYCTGDVVATRALYQRVAPMFCSEAA